MSILTVPFETCFKGYVCLIPWFEKNRWILIVDSFVMRRQLSMPCCVNIFSLFFSSIIYFSCCAKAFQYTVGKFVIKTSCREVKLVFLLLFLALKFFQKYWKMKMVHRNNSEISFFTRKWFWSLQFCKKFPAENVAINLFFLT